MQPLRRLTSAPDQEVLNAAHAFAVDKFKKVDINLDGNTLTLSKKVMWQQQTTTIAVANGELTAEFNTTDSMGRAVKIIQAIDSLLNDQGWSDAVERTGATTVRHAHVRDQVLPLLYPDETVVAATQGLTMGKTSIVVATSKRVLVVKKETLGFDSEDRSISLDKISSVSASRGFALGGVEITTSNEEIKVDKVVNAEADAFVRELRNLLDNPAPAPTAAPAPAPAVDADQLAKLAELHAAGVLTDEEFAAAKAKALGL